MKKGPLAKVCLLAGFLLLFSPPLLVADDAIALKPFVANYSFHRDSIEIGKVEVTLQLAPTGEYRYRSVTVPIGLAAILSGGQPIQILSTGHIKGRQVIPIQYRYQHELPQRPRHIKLDFDWEHGSVTNAATDAKQIREIPQGTQDKFSTQLALMLGIQQPPKEVTFTVADEKKIKTYHFQPSGDETITVDQHTYQAIKMVRFKENKEKPRATLWLAPELNNLPVKIKKQEKDADYTMQLLAVHWDELTPHLAQR